MLSTKPGVRTDSYPAGRDRHPAPPVREGEDRVRSVRSHLRKDEKAPAGLLQGHSQDPEPTNNADQDGAGQPGLQSRNQKPHEVRCLSEIRQRAVV